MEQASMTSAYMLAVVVMAVFFLIAVVIANMVSYKPNNPGTTTRRIWFWALCIATPIVGFLINYAIAAGINVPNIKSDYLMHSGIAAGLCLVVYILAGIIISKLFSNKKVGTWF